MEQHLDIELTDEQLETVAGGNDCGSNHSNCGKGHGAGGVGQGQDHRHDPF